MEAVKSIDINQAEVKTATISVHVLKIAGKQVTLSVFRQIPFAPIYGKDLALRGRVWGFVNYWWDGCGLHSGIGQSFHILWQSGDLLRRGDLPRGKNFSYPDSVTLLHTSMSIIRHDYDRLSEKMKSNLEQKKSFEASMTREPKSEKYFQENITRIEKTVTEIAAKMTKATEEYHKLDHAYKDATIRWDTTISALNIPQLFIAT